MPTLDSARLTGPLPGRNVRGGRGRAMKYRIAALAASLALAGCGGGIVTVNAAENVAETGIVVPEPANEPPAGNDDAPASTMLGSVDLSQPISGSGAEPFWGIEINGSAITYTDASVDPVVPQSFAPATPVVTTTTAVYATTNSSNDPVTLTLTLASCDGLGGSDTTRPLTVTLEIGGQTREGCAGPA